MILLTARDTVVDKVSGLDSGAVDYVTKPFAIEELLARIRAALRRTGGRQEEQSTLLTAGPVALDPESRTVTVEGTGVELTRREFDLLACLLEHKGKVLSRSAILNMVWATTTPGRPTPWTCIFASSGPSWTRCSISGLSRPSGA